MAGDSVRQLRFAQALNELAEVALTAEDRVAVMQAMARLAGATLEVDRALVYDVRLDAGEAVGLAEWLNPGTPAITPTLGTYPVSLFGQAQHELWRTRRWLESHAEAPHPSLGAGGAELLHRQMGIASLLWLPFSFRERGFHLLAFNQLTPRRWSDEAVAFIEAVGRRVQLTLQKFELLEGLAASEARFRALYDDTPSMFFTVSAEHTVTSVNRFAVEHLGYGERELLDHDVLGVFVDEDKAVIERQLAQCFAEPGRVFHWEARKVRRDGSVLAVREIARVGRGPTGRPEALIVCDDVSEQKRTEHAMLQAQKLESLGVLVGSIAHDFNNLLGVIVGNAELGLLRLPPESPAKEPVELAARAALRSAELVRQLLSYSAKAPFTRQRVDVNELIREATGLLSVTVGQRAEVALELDAGLPPLGADPTQLRQVLMNLVHNAADAMEGRAGAVRVQTALVTLPEGNAAAVLAGRYARLEVSDTGVGMDAATLEHLFDPFFTTKLAGRGLGLAAVRAIVQRHGGAVAVESRQDAGSTFTVLLPVDVPVGPDRRSASAGPPASLPAGAPVLVVEAHPEVARVVGALLEEFGLAPRLADDEAGARAGFSASPRPRCVLLDAGLRQGLSARLLRAFRELDPAVPLILLGEASELEPALAGSVAGVLAKPFLPGELQALLARVLTAGERPPPPAAAPEAPPRGTR